MSRGRRYRRRVAAKLQRLARLSGVDVWGGTILLERSNGAALFRRKSYVAGLLSASGAAVAPLSSPSRVGKSVYTLFLAPLRKTQTTITWSEA